MQHIHCSNATRLNSIIDIHGWPGIALVGIEACRAAWLIAQHAISTPQLQRKFLLHLERAAEHNDVPAKQLAWLGDRIRFNQGRPQQYGSVLDWDENGELCCEIEDAANLDNRRKAVGLPAYADDLIKHRREVMLEGGQPPQDYEDYRKKAEQWASAVGWR